MEEEDEGSPEEHLELKEMREMLDKAIDELPEKCRLVFLMSREEGLKTKEIAEILSVQESTVSGNQHTAMKLPLIKLRDQSIHQPCNRCFSKIHGRSFSMLIQTVRLPLELKMKLALLRNWLSE